IDGAHGDSLVENAGTFINERKDTAVDDLFWREFSLGNIRFRRGLADERENLGIGRRFAVLRVSVPASTGLLTVAAHLIQLVETQRLAFAGLAKWSGLLPDTPADVYARHVVHGENAHGHAPVIQRLVHLFGRRAVFHHEL